MRNYKYYSLALSLMALGLYSCAEEEFGSTIDELDPDVIIVGSTTVDIEDKAEFSIGQRLGSTYVWSATGAALEASSGAAVWATFADVSAITSGASVTVTETTRSGKTVTESFAVTVTNNPPVGTLSWAYAAGGGFYQDGAKDTLFASYDRDVSAPNLTTDGLTAEISGAAMTRYKTTDTYYSIITFDVVDVDVDFVVSGAVRNVGAAVQDADAETSTVNDNVSPTASITASPLRIKDGASIDISIDFDEAVIATGDSTLTLTISGDNFDDLDTLLKWNGTWATTTYTFKDDVDLGDDQISFSIGDEVTDLAGNVVNSDPTMANDVITDNTKPSPDGGLNITGLFVSVYANTNEAGTFWFVLQDAADAAPIIEDFTGNAVLSGSFTTTNDNGESNAWDAESVPIGDYELYVYAIDEAGNKSDVKNVEGDSVTGKSDD